jgi:hypothetical protein
MLVTVERPEPNVALIEAASPSHREYFFVVAGEHNLVITAYEASEQAHPEARVLVVHKPHSGNTTPRSEPATSADDHELLVSVWQLMGSS